LRTCDFVAGPSDAGAKIGVVTEDTRSARTERLLVSRLEALARAAASLPSAERERLVELATIATMRAVALDLLAEERAQWIWREAHMRHPALRVKRGAVALPTEVAA
jgi:hypothetical protein